MKWIRVEDRLPDIGEEVLVWIDDEAWLAFFQMRSREFYTYRIDGTKPPASEITHWAEITPPE